MRVHVHDGGILLRILGFLRRRMHVRLPKMDRWPYVNVVALGALCYMLIFSLIGLFPLLARSFADDHEEDGRAHSFADGHEEDGIGFPPALYLAPCVRAAVVREADCVPRCQAGKAKFDWKAVMPTAPTPTLSV
jgi:hypothetical protein